MQIGLDRMTSFRRALAKASKACRRQQASTEMEYIQSPSYAYILFRIVLAALQDCQLTPINSYNPLHPQA